MIRLLYVDHAGFGAGCGVGKPTFDVDFPSEEIGAGLAGSLVGGGIFAPLGGGFIVCFTIRGWSFLIGCDIEAGRPARRRCKPPTVGLGENVKTRGQHTGGTVAGF
jgi:hypothetical protein